MLPVDHFAYFHKLFFIAGNDAGLKYEACVHRDQVEFRRYLDRSIWFYGYTSEHVPLTFPLTASQVHSVTDLGFQIEERAEQSPVGVQTGTELDLFATAS